MKFYLAPLEGITGYIYRNALESIFPGADRYFTPFIVPDAKKTLRTKELRDVLPENNQVGDLIPQILTNQADRFREAVQALQEYGYREVNLNLGCPSGTVVSHKKGAGFLSVPDELDRFLDEIYRIPDIWISIKTRIGMEQPEEGYRLMEIYNQHPVSELIIHPRTRSEFYKGEVHRDVFGELAEMAKMPVCYNGNLLTPADYLEFRRQFPKIETVMLGRGVIANPALIRELKAAEERDIVDQVLNGSLSKEEFLEELSAEAPKMEEIRSFHDEIFAGYRVIFDSDVNAMFHMKEFWSYLQQSFEQSDKYMKKIKKAKSVNEYRMAVDELLRSCRWKHFDASEWSLKGQK